VFVIAENPATAATLQPVIEENAGTATLQGWLQLSMNPQ